MKKLFYLLVLLIFFASCQPSKITQTWSASDAVPGKYRKILVLGVLGDADQEFQAQMEDHLAGDLKALGYTAVAANKVFPPGTFVKGDTARAIAALEGKGFDGIFTVVLLDKRTAKVYIPGGINDQSTFNDHSRFERYINRVSDRIYSPGYYTDETKFVWENNFYDINSRQLIYSARTRSFDITTRNSLAHAYGQLMAASLVRKKILVNPSNEYEK